MTMTKRYNPDQLILGAMATKLDQVSKRRLHKPKVTKLQTSVRL